MAWLVAHRRPLFLALVALIAGIGTGLAVAPDHSRTVRVASVPTTTVTRTVLSTRTYTRTISRSAATASSQRSAPPAPGAPPAPAAPPPSPPSSTVGSRAGGAPELRYAGLGPKALGTITVRHESTLHWTSGGGRFRLFYNRTGLAVDSVAREGQIGVPAMTYEDVKVNAPGQWTIRIG